MSNAWKGAEAWHLLNLAMNYLYNKKYIEGLVVSNKLLFYLNELDNLKVFGLICFFSKKIGYKESYIKFVNITHQFAKKNDNEKIV